MRRVVLPALCAIAAIAATMWAGDDPATTTATIVVRLPADATLTVGTQKAEQRGSERRFVTPGLVPGYTYSYEVTARWISGGSEVTSSRTVEFRPGQTVVLDLRRGATTASAEPVPAPKKYQPEPAPAPKPQPKPAPQPKPVAKQPAPSPGMSARDSATPRRPR